MKRALIIALCGLLLALIMHAASEQKEHSNSPKFKFRFNSEKCVEPKNRVKSKTQCLNEADSTDPKTAEIFLRKLKRRPRVAYA